METNNFKIKKGSLCRPHLPVSLSVT